MTPTQFHADWAKFGKRAGPIRNAEMAAYAAEANGVLIAIKDPLDCRGTTSMIEEAEKVGIKTYVYEYICPEANDFLNWNT